jgi:predicted phage tail protein
MADSGLINLGPVLIEQLFTAGNILEDSYKLEYLRSEERRPFKAVMRYRKETKNKLPEEKIVEVKLPDQEGLLPQEQFDLTQFCTSEDHAIKVAKYFLGIRKLVSHTISFSTTVHGLSLRAGSYIKVITEATPYSAANTGTVNSSGVVTSVSELADGEHNVSYFKTGSEDVEEGIMQVSGGVVADSTFHGTVFTIKNTTVSQNVYVVEQLTFSEEGTVDIVASEHPCDDDGVSELAKLIAGDSVITVRS